MTETTTPRLTFGLNDAIPDGYEHAVWGARLIYPADLLWDRQDTIHLGDPTQEKRDKDLLFDWLNGTPDRAHEKPHGQHPLALALAAVRRTLTPSENRQAVLYEDESGVIVGNPRASGGYVYIAAWLKEGEW